MVSSGGQPKKGCHLHICAAQLGFFTTQHFRHLYQSRAVSRHSCTYRAPRLQGYWLLEKKNRKKIFENFE